MMRGQRRCASALYQARERDLRLATYTNRMERKGKFMLVIVVETARLRWFVAAVGVDGRVIPLLRSDIGDLEKYQDITFDEQITFLRHRLCGILQRGCDQIWGMDGKACQFVILFEGLLVESTGRLTQAVGNHLTEWILNPPLAVFNLAGDSRAMQSIRLENLAGHMDPSLEQVLRAHLGQLQDACRDLNAWELWRKKNTA